MFGVEGREGDPQRVLQTVCRLWRANWRGKMKGEEGRGGEKWNYSTWVFLKDTRVRRCKIEKQAVGGRVFWKIKRGK